LARTSKYEPDEATCPIPLAYLGKDRVTKYPAYTSHDRWRNKRDIIHQQQQEEAQPWTSNTCFKILQASRQQAATCFYTASNGHSTYIEPSSTNTSKNKRQPQTKAKAKARKEQLSEKNMTLEDRLSFAEAKKAELASFFQNDVWEIDDRSSAPEGRVLKAHFILKWSKHADGTPRAKARLITQGFRDPDALAGVLTTVSYTQPFSTQLHPGHSSNERLAHILSRHIHSLPPRQSARSKQNPVDTTQQRSKQNVGPTERWLKASTTEETYVWVV
jgi:hypothetical protein